MNIEHLISEVRLDKNGKATKRWVAPAPSGADEKKEPAIPAPVSPAATPKPILSKALQGYAVLRHIPPRAAAFIERELGRADAERSAWIYQSIIGAPKGLEASHINNVAAFCGVVRTDRGSGVTLHQCLEGLRKHSRFYKVYDFMRLKPNLLEEAQALVYAAMWLDPNTPNSFVDVETDDLGIEIRAYDLDDDEYDEYADDSPIVVARYIHDMDLHRLIRTHPKKVKEIVALINDYGIKDVHIVENRVLHPEPALRDGVL